MRLLNTQTFKLRSFVSPEDVEDGYAILSHCWGETEQSFQDLQNIHERCATSGENLRDLVSEKIRKFCELAEQHGYKYGWVDTCCIDKTSSAELSEAINSMFQYYSFARVCYAYLQDVPTRSALKSSTRKGLLDEPTSPFSRSRWHTRGWTLQELIAPRFVLFISKSWDVLGSKADLAEELQRITRIPVAVLRLKERVLEMGVAQRISWAADRHTTRPEDEAYCLLGLFGIHMPTLYGEGGGAFQRLQEAIMKKSEDTTLFAWGYKCNIDDLVGRSRFTEPVLFASSPSKFRDCGNVRYTPNSTNVYEGTSRELSPPKNDKVMTFSITPRGVLAHIPLITIGWKEVGDLSWSEGQQRLFLVLKRHHHSPLPMFEIGSPARIGKTSALHDQDARLVRISASGLPSTPSKHPLPPTTVSWQDVYLLHKPLPSHVIPSIPMNHVLSAPIRIPEYNLATFLRRYNARLGEVTNAQLPWTGNPPTTITFHGFDEELRLEGVSNFPMILQLGSCVVATQAPAKKRGRRSALARSLWAHLRDGAEFAGRDSGHDCSADHIATWPDMKRTFDIQRAQFTLSFTPCPFNPSGTFVLDVS